MPFLSLRALFCRLEPFFIVTPSEARGLIPCLSPMSYDGSLLFPVATYIFSAYNYLKKEIKLWR
jgi:hypothetical protein